MANGNCNKLWWLSVMIFEISEHTYYFAPTNFLKTSSKELDPPSLDSHERGCAHHFKKTMTLISSRVFTNCVALLSGLTKSSRYKLNDHTELKKKKKKNKQIVEFLSKQ